jgi:type II secretory pathway pseudopilin PulG
MKKFSMQSGFTLIELLVVAGVFVTLSVVILSIFVIALRGSSKSDYILSMKQNGNFTMSQIVKQIRFAKSLDSPVSCVPSVTQSSLKITSLADNGQTTFSCPAGSQTAITSNSASLLNTNRVAVTACSFTCSQTSLSEPPTVTIKFTLAPKAVNQQVETVGTIPFQTAVTLRNY